MGLNALPDGIRELRSVNPKSFPAKCLNVKLNGRKQSNSLFIMLWSLYSPGLLKGQKGGLYDL